MAPAGKLSNLDLASPTEDCWTVVLPRHGKKNRSSGKPATVPVQQSEGKSWVPFDVDTNPERESKLMQRMHSCLEKVRVSEFARCFFDQMRNPDMMNRFLKVLASEEKMHMVIYGIGSIESREPPRLQLSLAILMKRSFDWIGDIEVFDPVISLTESNVLASLGCTVLSLDEQGRRQVLKPTMFFMPHCDLHLYENLLKVNWAADGLVYLVLLGNSFSKYEQRKSLCINAAALSNFTNSSKHLLGATSSFAEEFSIKTFSGDFFPAFNDSSWHFFSPVNAELPC